MSCDILNLDWASKGRDIDIVEPILSYLEIKYGLNIVRESVFNFEFKLLKYKPRMLLFASTVGADENFKAAKLASKLGIKVVTLVAEGDYAEHKVGVEEFFWGWNRERKVYEDLHLEWTQRSLDLIHQHIPHSKNNNIKVSGATGFDRYKMFSFMQKEYFLAKYKKQKYQQVIGFAAWGFDHLFGEYYKKFEHIITKFSGINEIELHRKSKDILKDIYKKIIENNPEILFILKDHPGVCEKEYTEFFELDKYENTVFINREENIADVINVSDIWIGYESTTCLEAWLLGKQTMLINPLGGNFKRSRIAEGSPIKTNYGEAQKAIDGFYKTGEIPGFKEIENRRKDIIKQVIEWDDGKNHIRAAEYIYDNLFTSKRENRIDFFVIKRYFRALLLLLIFKLKLSMLKPYQGLFYLKNIFDYDEREKEHQKYLKALRGFYAKNNIVL